MKHLLQFPNATPVELLVIIHDSLFRWTKIWLHNSAQYRPQLHYPSFSWNLRWQVFAMSVLRKGDTLFLDLKVFINWSHPIWQKNVSLCSLAWDHFSSCTIFCMLSCTHSVCFSFCAFVQTPFGSRKWNYHALSLYFCKTISLFDWLAQVSPFLWRFPNLNKSSLLWTSFY